MADRRRERAASKEFRSDLTLLCDYSLVTQVQDKEDELEMHSLVQSFARTCLEDSGEQQNWRRCFRQLMAKHYSDLDDQRWKECAELAPHVEPLIETTAHELKDQADAEFCVTVLCRVSGFNSSMGAYQTIISLLTRAEALAKQALVTNHPSHLIVMSLMGNLEGNLGNYREAELNTAKAYFGL